MSMLIVNNVDDRSCLIEETNSISWYQLITVSVNFSRRGCWGGRGGGTGALWAVVIPPELEQYPVNVPRLITRNALSPPDGDAWDINDDGFILYQAMRWELIMSSTLDKGDNIILKVHILNGITIQYILLLSFLCQFSFFTLLIKVLSMITIAMLITICLSVCLSLCLSVYPSIHSSIYQSINLFVYLSIFLFI